MEQFLQETKSCLAKKNYNDKTIHVVIGNEACDLDSVISALTYGYFLHKTSTSSQTLCLPVLNTQKSRFHLKTDTKFLLSKTGINPDCLTFKDDLDLHDLHQQGRLSLTLVDHNVLVGGDVVLEDSVSTVIDHRPLERKPSDRVKVVQDLVGSCCSLVSGILLDCPEFTLCPLTATLLLGTILVDTVNTSPEAGKTTLHDEEMLRRLTQIVPDLDKDQLYKDIQEAKNDITALSTQEVLEKDLKCVVHGDRSVVTSSVPASLEVFLCRPDVLEAMGSVMHERKGQSMVVMTMHVNKGVPSREILIFSQSEAETKKLAEFLKTNQEIELSLQPFTCDLKSSLAYYQGNVKASRKKVLPLVKSYLQVTNIPQGDLLLNFDPLGSTVNSDTLLDFSDNSASVPKDSGSTNPIFLLEPAANSNNNSTSRDLLGLFDSTATQNNPKINIKLSNSPEGPSTSSGIPDLLGDFTEADVMESPLRTPDLMQSLSEASSGPGSTMNSHPGSGYPSHTVTPPETATPPNSLISSGFHSNNEFTLPSMNNAEIIEKIQQKKSQMMPHGSRGDSSENYPFTPNNSVADIQFDSLAREHNLRTLNNSQMVQQVEHKRKSLGGEAELLPASDLGGENVPFTPQNSFVSEQFSEFYSRESSLPSLNNAEMLQRIQEKRASMAGGDIEADREEEEDSVPFTPQNSFIESNFDLIAKEYMLPSLNNADTVRQVQQKRSSLSSRLEDTEAAESAAPVEGGVSSTDAEGGVSPGQSFSPFTPQNSFVESNMEKFDKLGLDFNSLNTRLLDISQDKPTAALPLVPNLSQLDPMTFNPTTTIPENVVAKKIAEDMTMDSQQASASWQLLELDFDDDNDGDSTAKNHGKSSGTMGKEGAPGAQKEGSQSDETGPMKGDSPLQDVAFSLAGDLIEHVLDNFEPEGVLVNNALAGSPAAGDGSDVLEPTLEKPVEERRVPSVTVTNIDPESPLRKAASNNQLITLETEYLSRVDPFHGNYDLVTNQGDREVVESSSFRRISGESPKTVREEILKAVSPESLADKELSAGSEAGSEEEWNEERTEKNADRKIEEGKEGGVIEEKDGIKIETEDSENTEEHPPSPLLQVAQNLTEAVIKNAVQLIQSETVPSPESNEEKVTSDSPPSPESNGEKVTSDSPPSPESMEEKVTSGTPLPPEANEEKVTSDSPPSPESNEKKVTLDSPPSPESNEEKVTSNFPPSPESNKEKVTSDSPPSPESNEEKVTSDTPPSPESNEEKVTSDSPPSPESNEDKVSPDSLSLPESNGEKVSLDSPSLPESNEENVNPDSPSMFNFDSVDSMEESGSSPSDRSSSTTEASYRLSSPECTGGAEGEDRPVVNNSCLSQGSISNESLSSYAVIRSDVDLDKVQKSGISFGSISNESLSSYSGMKSDQNEESLSTFSGMKSDKDVDKSGGAGLSVASISNESLASYSGVKSDMNLVDLQGEVFPSSDDCVPGNPPSITAEESADAKVTEESSVVLFKVESDDNLEQESDEMRKKIEGASRDMVINGLTSVILDEEVRLSESSMSSNLTPTSPVDEEVRLSESSMSSNLMPMSPVDEEGTVKSSQSNEGLASMSVSSDAFDVVDSTGRKDTAEDLDETKKTSSNDMNDQEKKFKDRLRGLDLSDEWQEDDIPGMPPAENVSESSDSEGSRSRHSSNSSFSSTEGVRSSSLITHPKKKITANLNILSDDLDDDGMDPGDGLEWENDTPIKQMEPIPQFSAQDEYKESKLWKGVEIGGKSMKIDLKVIEPYKRVLSHGGYYGDGLNAIIIFSGCYLPDRSRRDYQYVMDNLFMYVISTLETLVAEDYMIVYFHGATPRRQMPSFGWLKKCYQMIDRRLRKNLKSLLLIHPTLWLKTIVMMTRPFISAKFSSKLRFVRSLSDLGQIIPMEYINVPEQVQQYDDRLLQHRARVSSPLSLSPEPLTSPS
ncbi:protein prune homolog 2-like isoform X2 [Ostrea edulis]|uniref:protein prune homolog 2-like isoform X2 n=1 Tax=Ostrea edulis TaxID=37623 RepID=UPI0024AF601D|nr:protein prune homolog 2-like isoform X2 [Ostrea edulis]